MIGDLFVPIPPEMYYNVPKLEREIALREWAGRLLGPFVSPATKEQWANEAAWFRQVRDIRVAKDEAAKVAKDLTEFFEQFTPKDIPPPDQYQDPYQNVAAVDTPQPNQYQDPNQDVAADDPDTDVA